MMNGISLKSIEYMEFQINYYRQLSRQAIKSMCELKGQSNAAKFYQISHPAAAQYQKGKLPPIKTALQILKLDAKEGVNA